MRKLLLSVIFVCLAGWGYAQSSLSTDSAMTFTGASGVTSDNCMNMAGISRLDNTQIPSGLNNTASLDNTLEISDFNSNSLGTKQFDSNRPRLGFYAYSKENAYLNLLDSRSATAGFYLKYYNLRFDALLTANKYLSAGRLEPVALTNQFGISGILQYNFSPNWSVAAWGSYYNVNPYYSMAALPFIQTSSYGGYLQYKGDKAGIKLGAQSYYDAFRKQWRTEPIVTPTINISKKVKLEFPIGSLLQQSMERMIINSRGNGPVIPQPQMP